MIYLGTGNPPPQVKRVKQITTMALLDGPGSIPRIHVVANNCHCGPNAFFWSFQDYMHTVHKHTSGKTPIHTKQKQILKIIKMTELYHSKQISKKKMTKYQLILKS